MDGTALPRKACWRSVRKACKGKPGRGTNKPASKTPHMLEMTNVGLFRNVFETTEILMAIHPETLKAFQLIGVWFNDPIFLTLRCTREREPWQRITTFLANLSWLASLLLLVVCHKLKLPSTLMPMAFSMCPQWTKALAKRTRSLSPMTKVK